MFKIGDIIQKLVLDSGRMKSLSAKIVAVKFNMRFFYYVCVPFVSVPALQNEIKA